MSEYYNVTTNAGDAAIATAIANNNKLNITHVAFGDGNGSVPTPNKTRSALVHEVHRQAVTKYTKHPSIANYIVIETIIPSSVGGFWIREMGIIADNVLISHGSHAPFFKVSDPDGVSEYRLKFTQDVRDGSVVEIVLDESLIYASQAWVNENYIRRNELIDNLTTDDATKPLTAKQGKVLQDNKLEKTENSASSTKLKNTRKIFGQDFDGTNDVGGNITTATGMVASDSYHYIDMGRSGVDRMNFAVYGGIFNFIDAQNGNVIARLNSNGIDCNAASASKLQILRTINFSGAATGSFNFDGSANASCILTLANSGVTAGTYASTIQIPSITVNAKGLITSVSQQNIRLATTNQTGVVQIVDDLVTDDSTKALTAKQGKVLQDNKLDKTENSASSTKLKNTRKIFGQDFDGTNDVGGNITTATGMVASDSYHYIDMGRSGVDRMNFAVYGGIFNFIDAQNGNVIARLNSNGIDCNAATATKLQNPRAINGVTFDGTQAITITAEQRLNGGIGNESQLNAALTAGVYVCSSENGLADLYGYGVLQVYRSGNVISQVYFPHQLSGNNENIVALRQTWNGGSSWLGWYYLGQKDSSKLPLAGGALTGLLSSNTDIKTTTWMYAQKFVGADGGNAIFQGNASTSTKLETARNIAITGAVSGSANFDGSGNITITTTANNVIGVGQSWSDVTSSRAVNTTYTNTTGKPIQIIVTTANWNNAGSFELVLDGVSVTSFGNQDGYNQSKPISAIVPNGSTYRVNGSFTKWSELR